MRQWDQVSEEFAQVSVAADEAPQGWERVRAHEGALRLAQADGSFAEEFVARTDLTQALYWTPKDPRTLVHFAWLRQALDPARGLDQDDRDAVLWRLKWAVDLIEDLPEVGLDALVAAIDDVEQVFRGDGYHLRPGARGPGPARPGRRRRREPSSASSPPGSPSPATAAATARPASCASRPGWCWRATRPGRSSW